MAPGKKVLVLVDTGSKAKKTPWKAQATF